MESTNDPSFFTTDTSSSIHSSSSDPYLSDETNEEKAPTGKNNFKILLIFTIFVLSLLFCLILSLIIVFLIFYFSGQPEENDSLQIPSDMKKLHYYHLKYDKTGELNLNSIGSSYLVVPFEEWESEAKRFSLVNEDEEFVVTDEDLQLNCQVTCSCSYLDEKPVERRLGTLEIVLIGAVAIITFEIGWKMYHVVRELNTICNERCIDAGAVGGESIEKECTKL